MRLNCLELWDHIVRTHQTGAALVSLESAAAAAASAFAAGWANAAAREPVARAKMLARVRNCMAQGKCILQDSDMEKVAISDTRGGAPGASFIRCHHNQSPAGRST